MDLMGLIDLISNWFKIFFATCACIVPIAIGLGWMISIPFIYLSNRFRPTPPEMDKGSEWKFSWPVFLVTSFFGGFASFPIARLVNGSRLTLGNYLAVALALIFFALIAPGMSGETLVGASDEETNRNLYALWAGLGLGGLAGALSMWFWTW